MSLKKPVFDKELFVLIQFMFAFEHGYSLFKLFTGFAKAALIE